MKEKGKQLIRTLKDMSEKVMSVGMSCLMVLTGMSVEGLTAVRNSVEDAYALDLYNEGQLSVGTLGGTFGGTCSIPTLGHDYPMYYMTINGTPAFCMDLGNHSPDGGYFARTASSTGTIGSIIGWYQGNGLGEAASYAMAQGMIWAVQGGITDAETVAQVVKEATASFLFSAYMSDDDRLALVQAALSHTAVTWYTWDDYDSENQRFASVAYGETPQTGEQSATATAKAGVELELDKYDSETGCPMEGVTYEINIGGTTHTVTTDEKGHASYATADDFITASATSTKNWTTAQSTPNKNLIGADGSWYTSSSEALAAAQEEAEKEAKQAVCDKINSMSITVTETKTLENYYIDSDKSDWKTSVNWTTSSGWSGSWSGSSATFTRTASLDAGKLYNKQQHGTLTVTKKDTESGNTVKENGNSSAYNGATYEIYAAEDIKHTDGTCSKKYYSEGDKVGSFTTNSNGVGTYTGDGSSSNGYLYVGKYYYTETKAPNADYDGDGSYDYTTGHLKDSEKYPFEITFNGTKYTTTNSSAGIDNDYTTQSDTPQRVRISMEKKDTTLYNSSYEYRKAAADYDGDGAQGDATRKGATYGLYAADDIYYPDGSGTVTYNATSGDKDEITLLKGSSLKVSNVKATAGTRIATAVTDENGQIEWGHLYNGTYYVKEESVPTHSVSIWGETEIDGLNTRTSSTSTKDCYLLNSTKYYYDGSYTNQNTSVIDATPTTDSHGYVYDEVVTGYVEIRKVESGTESGQTTSENGAVFKIILKSDIDYVIENVNGYDDYSSARQYCIDNLYYDEITTATTTVNGTVIEGYAKSCMLPFGDYILVQTVAPGESALAADIEFSINTNDASKEGYSVQNDTYLDGRTRMYIIAEDMPFEAYLWIYKYDAYSGEAVTVSNASFKVVAPRDMVWGGNSISKGEYLYVSYGSAADGTYYTEDTWTTNDEGYAALPDMLPSGSYDIVEITTPDGYLKDATATALISQSSSSVSSGEALVKVYMTDTPVVGKVTVYKQGEVLTGVEQDSYTNNYSFIYEDNYLEGAVIGLYARENILDPATGEVVFKADTLIESKTSDSSGKITFDGTTNTTMKNRTNGAGLLLGSYYVKEITAPNGYFLNTESYNVDLEYEGDSTSPVTRRLTIEDERESVGLEAEKVNEEGTRLDGGKFTIEATSDIKDYKGNTLIKKGTVIETQSAVDGQITFLADLPVNYVYVLKEAEAPEGYVSNDFEMELDGTYTDRYRAPYYSVTIVNYEKYLEIYKLAGDSGNMLSGAVFELYDENYNLIASWVSSRYYPEIIAGLDLGKTYMLSEIVAPDGYEIAPDQDIYINQIAIQDVNVIDTAYTGTIRVVKEGEALTGITTDKNDNITFNYENKRIGGATFEIRAAYDIYTADDKTVLYEADELVATVTTENDKYVEVTDLPLGVYNVTEVSAPEGYQLSRNYTVQVDLTNTVYSTANFDNERQKVEINVSKEDSETEELLRGAEFTLYANEDIYSYDGELLVEKGTKIETRTTTSTGTITFAADLPLVEYTIRETTAPDGYYTSTERYYFDASYTVESDGSIPATLTGDFTFTNKESEIRIAKVDSSTGNLIGGNILQLYDSNDRLVDEWVSVEGEAHTVRGLLIDEIYTIVEKEAAEGYRQASSMTFNVVDMSDTGLIQYVTVSNTRTKGIINVMKRGEMLTGISRDADGNVTFEYSDRNLPDAVFEVYAEEDIKNPDGQSDDYYSKDELVETITTGSDGMAQTDQLPLGKYYVIEKSAPEGFIISSEVKHVELVYGGQEVPVVFSDTDDATFTNQRETVKITTLKNDSDDGSVVAGAGFGIFAGDDIYDYKGNLLLSEGMLIETVYTGTDGTAQFKADLPLSRYVVREVKAPDGYYSTDKEYELDCTYRDETTLQITYNCEFENEETRTYITKIDSSTGKTSSGNTLQVFDSEGNLVEEWVTDGGAHLIEKLTVGETYTLVERLAKEGYTVAASMEFIVSDSGYTYVEIDNNLVYGEIIVRKTGDALISTSTDEDGNVIFNYDERGIAGARFTVIATENIAHPDGSSGYLYQNGDVVAQLVTGSDGTASTGKIPLGNYRVIETTAPEGYLEDSNNWTDVSLGYKDQFEAIISKTVTFSNEREKVELEAEKVDRDDQSIRIEGAEFTLYADDDIYSYDDILLLSKGMKVETAVTDSDGHASFNADLPLYNYVLRETKAPDGYYSTSAEFNVDATYVGESTPLISLSYTFENIMTQVELSKQDITTGVETAGNYLQVFDEDGNLVDEWISEYGRSHIIKGLIVGRTYTMVEKLAADGYLQASNIEFTVDDLGDEGGTQTVVPMKDELVKGQITVEKKGEVLVGTETNEDGSLEFIYEERGLEGAEYEVYAREDILYPDGSGNKYYEKGDFIAKLVTGSDGKDITEKLPLGKYVVVEKTAPEGFVLSGETKNVDLTYEDQYTAVVFDTATFTNERQKVEISVTKLDEDDSRGLEGAEFALYPDDDIYAYDGTLLVEAGTEIARVTTDHDGNATFEQDLPLGQYTVEEVKAPRAYELSEETTAKVDASYQGQDKSIIPFTIIFGNKVFVIQPPEIEKFVSDPEFGESIDDHLKDDEADNNDMIEYLVVVNHIAYTKELVIHDYLDDQLDIDTLEIKSVIFHRDADDEGTVLTEGIDFTYSQGACSAGEAGACGLDGCSFEIDIFNEELFEDLDDDSSYVELIFDIRAKESADDFSDILVDEIDNDVNLGFKSYYNDDSVFEYTTPDSVETFSFGVELNKTDANGNSLTGAQFVLTRDGGSYAILTRDGDIYMLEDWTSDINEATPIAVDGNGKATIEGLHEGSYAVEEVVTPDGYVKAAPTDFEIVDDGAIKGVDIVNSQVFMKKTDVTGNEVPGAHIVVTDEEGNVVDEWDSTTEDHIISGLESGRKYTLTETQAPLGYVISESIDFVVTPGEDQYIEMVDKTFVFTKTDVTGDKEIEGAHIVVTDEEGNVVDEWDSTSESHAIIGLEEGHTYTLTETQAPDGYVISESVDFTVSDEKVDEQMTMKDKKVTFSKVDVAGEEVPGAHIVVTDEEGNIVDEWDSTTESHDINGLTEGHTYTLTETQAPDGYVISESIEFTVTDEKIDQHIEMVDKRVSVTKLDIVDGFYVDGAILYVTDEEGNIIDEWITTSEEHYISGLEVGHRYTLTERIPANGYACAESIEFVVNDDMTVDQKVVMYDEPTQVQISKTDVTGDREIPGAHLEVRDEDGTLIDEWISTEEAHLISGVLNVNETYTLTETLAPDGYAKSTTIEFTVADTGEVQKVAMVDKRVSVTKLDIVDGFYVEGAILNVTDKDGNVIDEWKTTKEEHYITGLEVGKTYTLTERIPANGYACAESIEFTVNDDMTVDQKIVMYDAPLEEAQNITIKHVTTISGGPSNFAAGDGTNLLMIGGIAAACICAAVATVVVRKKKNKDDDEADAA